MSSTLAGFAAFQQLHPWVPKCVVVELDDQWSLTVRSFANELTPPLDPSSTNSLAIETICPESNHGVIFPSDTTWVLWHLPSTKLETAIRQIRQTDQNSPKILQIVAGSFLTSRDRLLIQQLGAAATIRFAEDLWTIRRLIRRHVAARQNDEKHRDERSSKSF